MVKVYGLLKARMKRKKIIKILPPGRFFLPMILLGAEILSGCSRYELVCMNSMLPQNDKKEFVNENDTVSIRYAFNGENLPLTITVYNKLAQPLYIDPGRSTVVINNAQVSDAINVEGQYSFIAPLSYVTITSSQLLDHLFKVSPEDSMIIEKTHTTMGMNYSFSAETTPLFLRCILAITPNEDYSYPTFYDYSFWVSDVLQTYMNPKSVSSNQLNQSYIKKATGVGKTLSLTGSLLLLILLYGLGAGGE